MPADGCGLEYSSCEIRAVDPGAYRLVEDPGNVLDRSRYPGCQPGVNAYARRRAGIQQGTASRYASKPLPKRALRSASSSGRTA